MRNLGLYNIKVINKSRKPAEVTLKVDKPEGEIRLLNGKSFWVEQEAATENVFFILLKNKDLTVGKNTVKLSVFSNGKFVRHKKVVFILQKP